MKNRYLLFLTVFVLVLALMSGCTASGSVDMGTDHTTGFVPAGNGQQNTNGGDAPANASGAKNTKVITEEQAQTIALEHAGLTAQQVSGLRVRYDRDDGVPEYDVEFYYDGLEYEFEIHAETGKILSFEKDD